MASTPSAAGPDHRDLYLLIVGILAGVLLGPQVLGRCLPGTYERWFIGGVKEKEQFRAAKERIEADLKQQVKAAFSRQEEIKRELETQKANNAASNPDDTKRLEELAQDRIDRIDAEQKQAIMLANLKIEKEDRLFERAITAHQQYLDVRLMGLLLAAIAAMIFEALIPPGAGGVWQTARSRLATIRYALLAIWVAVMVAQPDRLREVPALFVLLVIVAAAVAAVVPLGARRPTP